MRFRAEHRFPGTVEAVVALLVDPSFHLQLVLPDLGPPELLGHDDDGTAASLRLRYEFVGHLEPIARRLLAGRPLTWIQELRVDRAARAGWLTFAAEANADRLHGSADFVLTPQNDETVRRLAGEVVVRAPVIASMAERRIVPGVLRRLDVEAQGLSTRLHR